MTVLKCKMCGGDIAISENQTVGTCESCGSSITLPKIDDERMANLFNRANHFRRIGEFDKAISAYENIIAEDTSIAEAHWGVVLCNYGIDYVEDPDSHERIPTCHRTSFDSIFSNVDYLDALQYADESARVVYESEANKIEEIQKGILAISKLENPFDIFISYKETTDGGSRTKDSVLAQDLYDRLCKEGYRVFFSRITLEDKLGQLYEPYIFSALNSAKVMLVITTERDNVLAPWVRNEWSRYLSILKSQPNRLLIPCYRDMDAYDLPEDLSIFQSQDMGKIGFEQDLIRGIKKVMNKTSSKTTSGAGSTVRDADVSALVRNGQLRLEDKQWAEADKYYTKALDLFPECVDAYIGQLCVKLKCAGEEDIIAAYKRDLKMIFEDLWNPILPEPLDCLPSYIKAMRFADPERKAKLQQYNDRVHELTSQTREEKRIRCQAPLADTHDSHQKVERELERIKGDKTITDGTVSRLKSEYPDIYSNSYDAPREPHNTYNMIWHGGIATLVGAFALNANGIFPFFTGILIVGIVIFLFYRMKAVVIRRGDDERKCRKSEFETASATAQKLCQQEQELTAQLEALTQQEQRMQRCLDTFSRKDN